MNFSNLCEIEIRLPIIEKKNKYSNIFIMFNNKIELEVKKIYKLQELKKDLCKICLYRIMLIGTKKH